MFSVVTGASHDRCVEYVTALPLRSQQVRTGVVLRRRLKGSVGYVKAMHTTKAKKGRDSERKHKTEDVRAK